MPPTIHNIPRHTDRNRNPAEKRSELVSRVKYNNTLPDIPFDPKSITYPFDTSRYVQYNQTSLERNYKFDLLTEHDLGVSIDLINADAYQINPNVKISPSDEPLIEDESNAPTDSKRSLSHRKSVSWLRKTEYISTEYNRFVQKDNKAEARVGFNINKKITDEILYKDRDSQIKAINATFDAASKPIHEHYSKPNVVPVEVLPLLPDFEMWKHPFAQVIFDSDPAAVGKSVAAQMEEMSQAIICGEQFVTYFLPTTETMNKRKRDQESGIDYEEEDEYEYTLAREYNWTVKNKSSQDYVENHFVVFRDTGVYYNELETRVRLSKRRKVGQTSQAVPKSRLVVRHRPLTSQEVAEQDARSSILEPLMDEDEEMEFHHKLNRQDEQHNSYDADKDAAGTPVYEDGEEDRDEENDDGDVAADDDDDEDDVEKKSTNNEMADDGPDSGQQQEQDRDGEESNASSSSGSEAGDVDEDENEDDNKEKEEIFGSESSDSD
ncbi:hypothetical protein HELRODRAFT_93221 [Helobdella robusta]|uniref:RNA polymerase II-associated factor 1 homolog n=1 Tax=Helobdella robusta TaxID=6412 RepID=T1G8U5_HELRO|nr:hypothetical protein HELRODRAFT_93221 [Helobdella robusta]ESO12345.1 hypothetical protein HELRODRAFT_93221 [Helobdella robusta]